MMWPVHITTTWDTSEYPCSVVPPVVIIVHVVSSYVSLSSEQRTGSQLTAGDDNVLVFHCCMGPVRLNGHRHHRWGQPSKS
jgi:hypothetical protein